MKRTIYAMEPHALKEYLAMRARAEKSVTTEQIEGAKAQEAERQGQERQLYRVENGDAILAITGVLSNQRNFIDQLLGIAPSLTYDEMIEAVFDSEADEQVQRIVLEIDSGGGVVDGLVDAADAIAQAEKPTVSRIRNMAASAAYWLASQADAIELNDRTTEVGSIGVVIRALNLEGIAVTISSSDAPKKEALYEPWTEDGRAAWVERLNELHNIFAEYVASGRDVTVETVNSNFGQGSTLLAEAAIAAGMADRLINTGKAAGVTGFNPAAKADETHEEGAMDIKALQREHPEVFAEAVEIGVQQERDRITRLQEAAQSDPDNAKLQEVVATAISQGKTLEDVSVQVNVAIRDFKRDENETPPDVPTAQHDTASGETDESDTESEEDQVKAVLDLVPKA